MSNGDWKINNIERYLYGNKRFEITETAGSVKGFYVVVDKETGVNYVVAKFGTGVGICPLIDKNGKPIVTE